MNPIKRPLSPFVEASHIKINSLIHLFSLVLFLLLSLFLHRKRKIHFPLKLVFYNIFHNKIHFYVVDINMFDFLGRNKKRKKRIFF